MLNTIYPHSMSHLIKKVQSIRSEKPPMTEKEAQVKKFVAPKYQNDLLNFMSMDDLDREQFVEKSRSEKLRGAVEEYRSGKNGESGEK